MREDHYSNCFLEECFQFSNDLGKVLLFHDEQLIFIDFIVKFRKKKKKLKMLRQVLRVIYVDIIILLYNIFNK